MKLSELRKIGVIKRIDTEPKLKKRLRELGLIEGTKIKFINKAPLGDPIQFKIRGYIISIRKEHANKIILDEEL